MPIGNKGKAGLLTHYVRLLFQKTIKTFAFVNCYMHIMAISVIFNVKIFEINKNIKDNKILMVFIPIHINN